MPAHLKQTYILMVRNFQTVRNLNADDVFLFSRHELLGCLNSERVKHKFNHHNNFSNAEKFRGSKSRNKPLKHDAIKTFLSE